MTEYKDFLDWQAHPVTQFFMGKLDEMREEMKESLASGTYTDKSLEATALKHADVIGRCTVLDDIARLTPEDLGLEEKPIVTKED